MKKRLISFTFCNQALFLSLVLLVRKVCLNFTNMWNLNIQRGWQPISADSVARIKLGDVVAPKPPVNKNSLVYTVTSIEHNGSLDLVSNPVTFSYAIGNLITGTIIQPEKLVDEQWWHFVTK